MKTKKTIILSVALAFVLCFSTVGFAEHTGKSQIKGTVTEIKVIEIELTVKDETGKETKARTKDTSGFKLGDRVIIKDGKVAKEVKPISGGY